MAHAEQDSYLFVLPLAFFAWKFYIYGDDPFYIQNICWSLFNPCSSIYCDLAFEFRCKTLSSLGLLCKRQRTKLNI